MKHRNGNSIIQRFEQEYHRVANVEISCRCDKTGAKHSIVKTGVPRYNRLVAPHRNYVLAIT
jgi:hypothetical protein